MLTEEIKNKILEFVALKPRSIDEIAKHIGKNWRTANSHVEKIARETGLIATRVFRKGTKGALKIVYLRTLRIWKRLPKRTFRKDKARKKER